MKCLLFLMICAPTSLTLAQGTWNGTQTNDNVAIGTSANPSIRLYVDGYTALNNQEGRTLLLQCDDDDSWLTFHDPGQYWYSMGIDRSDNGKFKLSTGGELGLNNHFVMDTDGNVGIGTNPDSKLTIKGTIHAQEVKVDLNGSVAPDYVFENDYNLLSLDEVQAYIKTNKHLPEIPSAKTMEEEGLNLKEMNLLLLKKVEELTLYVIELKKENEKIELLEEKINNLLESVRNDDGKK